MSSERVSLLGLAVALVALGCSGNDNSTSTTSGSSNAAGSGAGGTGGLGGAAGAGGTTTTTGSGNGGSGGSSTSSTTGSGGSGGGGVGPGQTEWAKLFGSPQGEEGDALAIDLSGNIVIGGGSYGMIDFGGGPLPYGGTTTMDAVLAKLDPTGGHLWSKSFGSWAEVSKVAVDASGNVAITGNFEATIDFGCGAITSAGGADAFLAKFDPDGNCLWSKGFGDSDQQFGNGLAFNADGSVLLAGQFAGTIDLGGGPFTSPFWGTYVAKFGPNGTHQWSKGFVGSTTSPCLVESLAVDETGDLLLGGYFYGTIDFGGQPLTSAGNASNAFLAKLDKTGAHIWSGRYGDAAGSDHVLGAAFDAVGNIGLTGTFGGDLDFGLGPMQDNGNGSVYVAVLDGSGVAIWNRSFSHDVIGNQEGDSASFDSNGDLVVTGFFTGSIDFGDGLLGAQANDIFVAKFSSTGATIWGNRYGGGDDDAGFGVALNAHGDAYLTGLARSATIDFGTGPLAPVGDSDIFLLKLAP